MAKSPLFNRPASGGSIFSVAGQNMTTGDIWFVDSGHAAAGDAVTNGSSPDKPFSTLDYAIGQATAAKGDVIYVMPGHAETATTAVELFDLDQSAISVIGLGDGDLRPTFTLSHVDATVVLGAAGCRINNLRLVAGIADLKTILEIEAAGIGSVVDGNNFGGASGKEALIAILVTADADRLVIAGNQFLTAFTGDNATECMEFLGGSDHSIIRDNIMIGDWDEGGCILMSAAASANIVILNNLMVNSDAAGNGLCYTGNGSTSGISAGNFMAGSKTNTQTNNTVTLLHCSENYGNDAANTTGILTPAAGA